MKVIKYGNNYLTRAICPSCKSEIEFNKSDEGIQNISWNIFGKRLYEKFIWCPVCKCKITTEENGVEYFIRAYEGNCPGHKK